jgi:Tol biopolymer transport system component
VGNDAPEADVRSEHTVDDGRLDSWKEIGAYLKRDVTTVRRWERREGLPVHRHSHDRRDSVYAYRHEIDRWWQERRSDVADKAPAVPVSRRERLAWLLVAVFATTTVSVAVAAIFRSVGAERRDADEFRFSILPPPGVSVGTVSLSPDGRQLAFTAAPLEGRSKLWVRPLRSLTPRALPDTEDAAFPFWAPDGQSIGFFAQGSLKRIAVSGGPPHIICEAPDGRGGTWNADGIIVFSPSRESGLSQVRASGGSPLPVTTVERPGERGHLWPEFLPDGAHFLYLADSDRAESHNLFVGSIATHERKTIGHLASNAMYVRGYLLFARDRRLIAQPFDLSRLEMTADAITLTDHVHQAWGLDHKADFAASASGILMYRDLRGTATQLVWRDRADHQSPLVDAPADYYEPTLSPDQKKVAVDIFDPRPSPRFGMNVARVTSDIWILDPSTAHASRFTFDPAADFDPVWSPDGRRIVFSSYRRGTLDLYQKEVDGNGEELLLASPRDKHAQGWSPDGRFLIFSTFDRRTKGDFWLLPMSGDRTPQPLLQSESNEEQAAVSPDGRWFAYTSDESGRDEVYVQSFPSPGAKWQISSGGGGDARWRADGKELFYIADDRRLMSVAINIGGTIDPGAPVPLFDTGMQPHWGEARNHYDISRDGKRFLFMTPVDDDRSSPFTVVVNWRTALQP